MIADPKPATSHGTAAVVAAALAAAAVGCVHGTLPSDLPQAQTAREAVIILPGLGDSAEGRRHMAQFGERIEAAGFDVLVPEYIKRAGVVQTVEALDTWLDEAPLSHYRAVHVFAYIIGTWSLNERLNAKPIANLKSLVYDRSPLQERAPAVAAKRLGLPSLLLYGRVLKQFSKVPYPPYEAPEGVNVGLLIEARATSLIRMFKGTTLDMGPVTFDAAALNQGYDDLMYTPLNHDELYTSFEVIGPELVSFFTTARFSEGARRTPFEQDPFLETWPESEEGE